MIIGGGIGGLCLAQGLRKAGISATVYERDGSAGSRRQGYRVSLKAAGAGALQECLPEDLFALAVATSIRAATRMVFLDEQLRPKFEKPLHHDPAGPGGFGVNRLTLREILLAGLDVRFGRTFTHYSSRSDGRVAAHFADGSSAAGPVGRGGRHRVGGAPTAAPGRRHRRAGLVCLWPDTVRRLGARCARRHLKPGHRAGRDWRIGRHLPGHRADCFRCGAAGAIGASHRHTRVLLLDAAA